MARERAAAGAAADDDHVVGVAHCELAGQLGEDDPPGGLDQREVGEGLGEVAEVVRGARVELLRVEPERRGDPQELFHQVAGALLLADDRQAGDQPEGADQEAPLLARHAVVGLVGAVAQDEAVLGEVVGDRQHARAQALVVARQEAEDRRQQVGGVERVGLVVLAQDAAFALSPCVEDVRPDLLGGRAPRRPRAWRRRGSPRAWPRGPSPPSTSAWRRRSAAACRAPPRSPGRACARRSSRIRPAPARSATAAGAGAGCGGCAAGSSRAPRRRRRSGAGRRRRCRSARDSLPRSRRGPRAWTRSGRGGRRSRT